MVACVEHVDGYVAMTLFNRRRRGGCDQCRIPLGGALERVIGRTPGLTVKQRASVASGLGVDPTAPVVEELHWTVMWAQRDAYLGDDLKDGLAESARYLDATRRSIVSAADHLEAARVLLNALRFDVTDAAAQDPGRGALDLPAPFSNDEDVRRFADVLQVVGEKMRAMGQRHRPGQAVPDLASRFFMTNFVRALRRHRVALDGPRAPKALDVCHRAAFRRPVADAKAALRVAGKVRQR